MKTFIKITTVLFLAFSFQGKAQTPYSPCPGTDVVFTAYNTQNLSNPTYSMNPGGIISSGPTFTVSSPSVGMTFTLYVTGTNSNSAVVTTTDSFIISAMQPPTFSLTSPQNFTMGCGTTSLCTINIINAQGGGGGAASYTLLPPGSSTTILPSSGSIGYVSTYSMSIPGSYTVAVRDNANFCTVYDVVSVTQNTVEPVIGNISGLQGPLTCFNPTTVLQCVPAPNIFYHWTHPFSAPNTVQGYSLVATTNLAAPTSSLAGTYTLTAVDGNNTCQSSTVITIYQNTYPPNAVIAGLGPSPLFICNIPTVALTNQSSTGIPPGSIFPATQPIVGHLWEGPSPQAYLTLSSSYVAYTVGVYTMTAMDMNNGCTDETTYTIASLGPVSAFAHTITGAQVDFNNISTGTNPLTTYFWDFGDGTTSTLQNPTHTYSNGGAHLVKFKITSITNLFCVDSVIQAITISGVPCVANSNFSMVPTATAQAWNIIPDYPWNITAAQWNWGDGSGSNTLYATHQYSAAGMYSICLTVTVSCGDTSTTCTAYNIYRGSSEDALMLQVNVVAPALISGLNDVGMNGSFSWNIAPNPNTGEFKLNLDTKLTESTRLVIIDFTGRVVHEQMITSDDNSVSVSPENLSSGLYMVSLESKAIKVTKRMIVNR